MRRLNLNAQSKKLPLPFLLLAAWLLSVPGCGVDSSTLPGILTDVLEDPGVSGADLTACGPIAISTLIPDCPLSLVCFTQACESHNACYGDCEANRGKCDLIFYLDMVAICNQRFAFNRANQEACQSLAFLYALAVEAFGEEAFEQTQLATCSDGPISPFTPGVCCLADDTVCEELLKFECDEQAGRFAAFVTCDEISCAGPDNDLCENKSPVCGQFLSLPDSGFCEGVPGEPCFPSLPACSDGSACIPDPTNGFRCVAVTDNRLARTDAPNIAGQCGQTGGQSFQADTWYEFVSPCSGRVTLRMCGLESYDSMLAVYGNEPRDGTCSCPGDGALLTACDDDFCGGASTSAIVLDGVLEGECLTIRVGGWSSDETAAAAGQGVSEIEFTVSCEMPTDSESAGAATADIGSGDTATTSGSGDRRSQANERVSPVQQE
ncbi:MAG: hypothetical protein ACYTHJ_18365 [Planctomycetota bacterium]